MSCKACDIQIPKNFVLSPSKRLPIGHISLKKWIQNNIESGDTLNAENGLNVDGTTGAVRLGSDLITDTIIGLNENSFKLFGDVNSSKKGILEFSEDLIDSSTNFGQSIKGTILGYGDGFSPTDIVTILLMGDVSNLGGSEYQFTLQSGNFAQTSSSAIVNGSIDGSDNSGIFISAEATNAGTSSINLAASAVDLADSTINIGLSNGSNLKGIEVREDGIYFTDFGDKYSFPYGQGTTGQTFIVDGSGNLAWGSASGVADMVTDVKLTDFDLVFTGQNGAFNSSVSLAGLASGIPDDIVAESNVGYNAERINNLGTPTSIDTVKKQTFVLNVPDSGDTGAPVSTPITTTTAIKELVNVRVIARQKAGGKYSFIVPQAQFDLTTMGASNAQWRTGDGVLECLYELFEGGTSHQVYLKTDSGLDYDSNYVVYIELEYTIA